MCLDTTSQPTIVCSRIFTAFRRWERIRRRTKESGGSVPDIKHSEVKLIPTNRIRLTFEFHSLNGKTRIDFLGSVGSKLDSIHSGESLKLRAVLSYKQPSNGSIRKVIVVIDGDENQSLNDCDAINSICYPFTCRYDGLLLTPHLNNCPASLL